MPKLVLPPHGAPGHPAHGGVDIDTSSHGVDRPHYPMESADTKPTRVHARQIVQPSPTKPTALKTSEAMSDPNGSPTPYPGQVVPPAAVAAANARNQALETQQAEAQAQAQAVAVKQLDVVPQAPAPVPTNHAAASAIPNAIQAQDSSSQQIVKAPSTPLPSNPSPISESSASYFSALPASSPSPSPQHISSPSAPSPTFTPNKLAPTNHNSTMSGKLLFDPSYILLYSYKF